MVFYSLIGYQCVAKERWLSKSCSLGPSGWLDGWMLLPFYSYSY